MADAQGTLTELNALLRRLPLAHGYESQLFRGSVAGALQSVLVAMK
jgi:hypothetical protein